MKKSTRKEEIEARKLEIREEVKNTEDTEKLEELSGEVDALNEELIEIKNREENEKKAEELEEKKYLAKEVEREERKMNTKEVRNSKEYINAYAEYIKSGLSKDYEITAEERALLTANVDNGVVAVPDMVWNIVKTAWEREELMNLVPSISVKGNFQVQFEVSGDDAVEHVEGSSAVNEENLALGIVTLIPKSIKKWISVSDEVLDMRGEAFLNYVYNELTYKIAKKNANLLVSKIVALPQTLTPDEDGNYTTVSANKITSAPEIGTIAEAIANLSDEANDVTVIINKLTYAAFKKAQYNGNFSVDPFEGARVIYNNTLPAYNSASAGAVYAIVGDFAHGSLGNFPNGDGIELKYDDKTLMTSDLVRILGRRYGAVEPIADKAFTLIAKIQSA